MKQTYKGQGESTEGNFDMGKGLAEIRRYLVQGESAEGWLGICEVLDEAEEASEREMWVGYVSQQTKGWRKTLRRPLYGWWERKQRGEVTGFEGLVGNWSMFVWGEGKAGGEVRVVPYAGGMRMRWIPAGTFWMGSGDNEQEACGNEKPRHEVTITRGFWMGETPVTQSQYEAIMGENPLRFKQAGLRAPVECVTWYDAAAFAKKLSKLEGVSACFVGKGEKIDGVGNKKSDYVGCRGWRLPTEAEWEYACRAGTTKPRYGTLSKIAWHRLISGGTTHPVGEKEANAWGLYDMLGNVWEWCYDWDRNSYEGVIKEDPVELQESEPMERFRRVMRGGSYSCYGGDIRSATRNSFVPSCRSASVGFRLLRSGR